MEVSVNETANGAEPDDGLPVKSATGRAGVGVGVGGKAWPAEVPEIDFPVDNTKVGGLIYTLVKGRVCLKELTLFVSFGPGHTVDIKMSIFFDMFDTE